MRSISWFDSRRAALRTGALLALAAGLVGITASRVPAQEVKPGPEHTLMKEWAGNWDAVIKMGGAESKGSHAAGVSLNGLWLLESFKGEVGGGPFEGRGATSYDPAKKKYVNIWIDSMSTSPMITEGTYDAASKTMTMTGTMPMPDGNSMKVKTTTIDKDADTRVFSLKAVQDGQEMEMIQITYRRRK
jgi:hypothetical protein